MSNLNLKKFDMGQITQDKIIVMIGKRNTGKSFLVQDLLYHVKDIPIGTVISATEHANKFYGKIIPPIFIHDEYNENIIENVMKRQTKIVKKLNKDIAHNSYSDINPYAFLIFDDLMYSAKEWIKSKIIKEIFMNGRHHKLLFILTMQFSLGIPPESRCNIDYVFILRDNIPSNRKRLFDHYAGIFGSLDIFNQVMDSCTNDYGCLVIDNSSISNILEDVVFWYKAESHKPFKIGSKKMWKFYEENCIKEDESSDEEDVFKTKKHKIPINIKKTK